MIIMFQKCSEYYRVIVCNSNDSNGWFNHFSPSTLCKLREYLNDHFDIEHITIYRSKKENILCGLEEFAFTFKRAEDEAFFQILTADGIEI